MTVGESALIGNNFHHYPVSDSAAHGHAGVRGQVFYEKRAAENALGIDFDQVVFVETQGEQAAADPFPALDIHDPQLMAVGSF